jgi:hypothetical protein
MEGLNQNIYIYGMLKEKKEDHLWVQWALMSQVWKANEVENSQEYMLVIYYKILYIY